MTLTEKQSTEDAGTTIVSHRRSSMTQVVGGGALISIGVLWLLERTGAIDVSVTAVLAIGTMIVGISLMVLAKDGPHAGLIVVGTLLALAALLTAAAPFEGFQGGVGDRPVQVSSADDINPDYNLAMGKLTVDLREIDDLQVATRVTASVGMGELLIRIPDDVPIRVDAGVGAGEIDILGREIDGVGLDEQYESPGFAGSAESLSLELRVFTGRVEVTDE